MAPLFKVGKLKQSPKVDIIFMDCADILHAGRNDNCDNLWRTQRKVTVLQQLLEMADADVELIPREWDAIADRLAAKRRKQVMIYPYIIKGMELPKWLMKRVPQERFYF